MVENGSRENGGPVPAEVVGFGLISSVTLVVADRLPEANTGTDWREVTEIIDDDAVLVVTTLRGWGARTGLIGTTLGDDANGRRIARALQNLDIAGEIRLSSEVTTPYELIISDAEGNRTYFWNRDPKILETLDTADLSMIRHASALYVDWYDGDHILRPMREAERWGVPVFLNFEHGHYDLELLARYAPYVATCQANTDQAQLHDNAEEIADRLLESGISTALVTMAERGCLVATRQERVRVYAPEVNVVDGCAAGATFSAAYIYGQLRGWCLEDMARLAVAASSLKCTVVGPRAFPWAEVRRLARQLRIQQCPRHL
jgi:sugar/nucleoside kinase (ribokinase family)